MKQTKIKGLDRLIIKLLELATTLYKKDNPIVGIHIHEAAQSLQNANDLLRDQNKRIKSVTGDHK